ncbi:signal recognition particle-docking protein FtsY [Corynebacterium sp. 4HC-13]|uniref:Signal recognition particle receptor FtsY n=2 Tax=Corynebacterium anserum TaxID=2684406 RepID=A0A7G7YR49_9CORY|nr:signal recognition particle-docking protein FtsY [Corynebacterium anserum]QNH96969.1 signal recognition particle-docking protein FtsY [Corynebacterium anserum]
MWIILGVVAVLLIALLIILFGLRRSKSKQISFEKKEEIEQAKPSSGNYKAQGGFNFTSGSTTTIGGVEITKPSTDGHEQPELRENQELKPQPQAPRESETAPESEAVLTQGETKPSADNSGLHTDPKPDSQPEVPAEPRSTDEQLNDTVDETVEVPVEGSEGSEETSLRTSPEEDRDPDAEAQPELPQEDTTVGHASQDEIAPVQGRMGKLRGRLSQSQNVIGRGVLGILSAGNLDEDAWEEIEDTLLMADLGTKTTLDVVDALRERIAVNGVSSEAEARAMLRSVLIEACKPEMDRSIKAMPYDGKPAVIMVVGVNGTGKTTTTGKLSRVLIGMGHSVTLGAADTFRAAAADQLETWGRRVGAKTVRGAEGADPASVAFDAVAQGIDDGTDVVLIDTAGRLHTSVGLMDQLGKVKRVVEKRATVDEVLLVLDATVGQNGLMQARVFREVVDITGVVLTKLDGTAKGGIVFQVQEELGVPVKLVGLGEGADHLAPFEVESFVDALLG